MLTNNTTSAPISFDYDPEDLLTYGYCTEFILQLQAKKTDLDTFHIDTVRNYLETIGNSIVAVQEGTIVKVHVHTTEPETALKFARSLGELVTIKIENMAVQHSEINATAKKRDHVKYAIVATASGSGIIEYFESVGVSICVDGGQTNNPSAEAFIDAFRQLNADHIIVLPNDSNIVLTAIQAAEMYTECDVRVLKTKSIAEGYSALSMLNLELDTVDEVLAEMSEYLGDVTTGYVTTATRDVTMNGVEVHKGNYIGLTNDVILSDSNDKVDAALQMLSNLPDIEDKQVISAFCGKDVTYGERSALRRLIQERYPLMDVGLIDGQQDVYSFIMAIE